MDDEGSKKKRPQDFFIEELESLIKLNRENIIKQKISIEKMKNLHKEAGENLRKLKEEYDKKRKF